ncbi:diguanylate phosphodiesterase [Fusobacterium animalis]|uniref:diguanylate phosphodiesterase n=1 Tax=Fusobacterium animalis TaxID=76859 RepID=UPI0030D2DF8C
MKNFELRPIYYPKGSYLNYILEIWVDGVNISQFYEDNKLRIDVGYIFHIYNFFDDYLEDIMKEEILPYENVEGKTIFETLDNIKEKYFYWLKDDYGHDEDDESDEEIEKIISKSESFYDWQRAHRWLLYGPFLCIPDIIFRRVGDKIEISWDTTWDITYQQRKYENENIKFISKKGVSYIDTNEFYLEIKQFLKKIDDISKIQKEKFQLISETGKLIYAKDPYNNIEFKEEKEFLQDLEKIDYKFFTIYELVLITEKDKKVVPIVLKYLSKIEDENIKTHLAYFLAVKNYKEASEKLIKEFYSAKTNEYRIALSKALSTIYNKDILNELLEMAENKEYKDVNFPIISTLNKYKNKRVKMFFEKNRME